MDGQNTFHRIPRTNRYIWGHWGHMDAEYLPEKPSRYSRCISMFAWYIWGSLPPSHTQVRYLQDTDTIQQTPDPALVPSFLPKGKCKNWTILHTYPLNREPYTYYHQANYNFDNHIQYQSYFAFLYPSRLHSPGFLL